MSYQSQLFRAQMWIRSKGICFYCGAQCVFDGAPNGVRQEDLQFTVDHRVPLSKGGLNVLANMVGCCHRCNRLKGKKTEQEFREKYLNSRRKS